MNRREFLRIGAAAVTCAAVPVARTASGGPQLAVTMDDFNVLDGVHMPAVERSARILATLKTYGAQGMALVIGRFAATTEGDTVLDAWAKAGHIIGNHTYSHLDYHAQATSLKEFAEDFRRADAILRTRKGFRRFFRFPMLHGGDTAEKRDAMRAVLERYRYREAHVTIDNADWLIDRELRARLAADPNCDTRPYRDLYLRHIRAFCPLLPRIGRRGIRPRHSSYALDALQSAQCIAPWGPAQRAEKRRLVDDRGEQRVRRRGVPSLADRSACR